MDFVDLRCKSETVRPRAGRRVIALVAAALILGGCAFGSTDEAMMAYTTDHGVSEQPYPKNYRAELLAFLRTYLNDPTNVRSAALMEPALREVGGRRRYVTCVRYSAKSFDGAYGPLQDRAVIYVDGRLDRLVEKPEDVCVGAAYAAFPELEKLTR